MDNISNNIPSKIYTPATGQINTPTVSSSSSNNITFVDHTTSHSIQASINVPRPELIAPTTTSLSENLEVLERFASQSEYQPWGRGSAVMLSALVALASSSQQSKSEAFSDIQAKKDAVIEEYGYAASLWQQKAQWTEMQNYTQSAQQITQAFTGTAIEVLMIALAVVTGGVAAAPEAAAAEALGTTASRTVAKEAAKEGTTRALTNEVTNTTQQAAQQSATESISSTTINQQAASQGKIDIEKLVKNMMNVGETSIRQGGSTALHRELMVNFKEPLKEKIKEYLHDCLPTKFLKKDPQVTEEIGEKPLNNTTHHTQPSSTTASHTETPTPETSTSQTVKKAVKEYIQDHPYHPDNIGDTIQQDIQAKLNTIDPRQWFQNIKDKVSFIKNLDTDSAIDYAADKIADKVIHKSIEYMQELRKDQGDAQRVNAYRGAGDATARMIEYSREITESAGQSLDHAIEDWRSFQQQFDGINNLIKTLLNTEYENTQRSI